MCRVLDYSKYKYEQAQKVKQARKHQQQITVREIKFRPKIAQHDYDTKKHHVERFLRHKDKVKVTIMFRGREVTHPERGTAILDRLAEELAELGVVEQRPMQEGRNMTMMMAPSKAVLAGTVEGDGIAEGELEGDRRSRACTSATSPPTAIEAPRAERRGADAPAAAEEPAADGRRASTAPSAGAGRSGSAPRSRETAADREAPATPSRRRARRRRRRVRGHGRAIIAGRCPR